MGMETVLKEIVEAESRAQEEINAANKWAKEFAVQEKASAQKVMAEKISEEKNACAKLLAQKEEELKKRKEEEEQKSLQIANKVSDMAKGNVEEAVTFLVERIAR